MPALAGTENPTADDALAAAAQCAAAIDDLSVAAELLELHLGNYLSVIGTAATAPLAPDSPVDLIDEGTPPPDPRFSGLTTTRAARQTFDLPHIPEEAPRTGSAESAQIRRDPPRASELWG